MRVSLLLACVLVLCAPSSGDEAKEARIELEGTAAVVNQPVGTWDQVTDKQAEGQWFLEYSDPAGDALMRAYAFPAGAATEPEKALVQAVDVFFRGMGVGGFGLPTRKVLDVWGCPGAEGSIAASHRGKRITGRARILFVSATRWAFAIGYAGDKATTAKKDAVHLFVGSLEPTTPRFYERTFHRPADHAVAVVEKEGEPPITEGMIAATANLLEAGIGARFPLGLRPTVRFALLSDAQDGPPKTRRGYRDAQALLKKLEGEKPDTRKASMRTFGKLVLRAILKRASQRYVPAVRFALAWQEHRLLSIGEREDGLTGGDLANGIEMSEFLASVAADREVKAGVEVRARLHGRLKGRWASLSAEQRAEGRAWGDLWAALRYAWDTAPDAKRLAFRAAVAARLAGPVEGGGARALKRSMKARPAEGLGQRALDAALDLDNAARRTLIEALGVKDPYGFHLGW